MQHQKHIIYVIGSTRWTDEESIRKYLSAFAKGTVVMHGDSKGADEIAGRIATELGFEDQKFQPQWTKYGRRAGHVMAEMLVGMATDVVVFPMQKSASTWDARKIAEKYYKEKKLLSLTTVAKHIKE